MDTPTNNVLTQTNQNIEIKTEIVDIVEIDEQIFTNSEYFGDDSQDRNNVSGNENSFNTNDDQFTVKEEIICKEEPEFYDMQTSQTFSR